jgi:N-formylglutamate deformylase
MRGIELHTVPGSPVLVSVPHSGTCVPAAVAARLAVPVEVVQARVDVYAWELARTALPGATVLRALYARAVVDLNRSGMVTGVDLSRAPELDDDRLVRLFGRQGEPLWRAPLGAAWLRRDELLRRVRLYHEPYHRALRAALQRAPRPCILVDVHSMDESAFDLVIGDHRGSSAGVEFCGHVVQGFFADRGYRVGYAGPRPVDRHGRPLSSVAVLHSGGFIDSRYGDPGRGCRAIQLEVSRPLAARRLEAMQEDFKAFFTFLAARMPRLGAGGTAPGAAEEPRLTSTSGRLHA